MRHQARLQDAINGRYQRLVATDPVLIDKEAAFTRDWIRVNPELRAILAEAEQVEPDLDYKTWWKNAGSRSEFTWSCRTEAGRASLVWQLMNDIAAGLVAEPPRRILFESRRYRYLPSPAAQGIVEHIFRPFFQYLSDQVGLGNAVVHVLQRYVAQVEWFDRTNLYARYAQHKRNGEEVYNLDLQRFLFLDGGYITQAKARSASGEADLIGGLDTDDPLICEGKLYDGSSRGKSYLAKGFHQVIRYAHDYNKTVAHLIVFNLASDLLQFQTDGPAGAWAPYVENAGVRVHLIAVRALPPDKTASKAGKVKTVVISREDLVTLDDQIGQDASSHETPANSGT
jgi:hypothetical protein